MNQDPGLRRLSLAGSVAAFAYLAAQTFQRIVRASAPTPEGADAELASHLTAVDQARALALWVSFWLIPVAYYALYVRYAPGRPDRARIGLAGSLAFVGCELSYRAIELFVVVKRWAAAWSVAAGDARAALAQRIAAWDDVVAGWYVLLLTAHVIGNLGFAAAVGWRGRWPERALFVTLLANGALMALRLGAYGRPALEGVCGLLYFPVVVPSFLAMGVALAADPSHQNRARTRPEGAL